MIKKGFPRGTSTLRQRIFFGKNRLRQPTVSLAAISIQINTISPHSGISESITAYPLMPCFFQFYAKYTLILIKYFFDKAIDNRQTG
ncbi:MAG: hypothetical protein ACI4GB_01850 [Acutalibacteraceae bacterium]